MLKRGLDTLKMEDYQVLFCEEGLAAGEELERLKIMSSTEHFVRLLPDILHAHVAVKCILQANTQRVSMPAFCFAAWLPCTSVMRQDREHTSQNRSCAARLCRPRSLHKAIYGCASLSPVQGWQVEGWNLLGFFG